MKFKAANLKPFVLAMLTTLIVACGQTGPLYLPEPSGQQVKQTESQQEKQDKNKDKQGNEGQVIIP